ncbi:hypothetical protein MtrunA17_Chr5g0426651 [Medicago truncatula]|uniref:Uncharacterized protein n=1 Tax=Medicago truncatula TaxID=3880 RepID=A0A396HUK2_MEDTR|nr:hypothetical protein MtrunA17_Chr5g0426651 [Medicago truncatula]
MSPLLPLPNFLLFPSNHQFSSSNRTPKINIMHLSKLFHSTSYSLMNEFLIHERILLMLRYDTGCFTCFFRSG